MPSQAIHFLKAGKPVTLHHVPPDRTLLEVLRDDLYCTGTKEGCGEGDCGACTVVVGEERDGQLQTRAVNSCIRLAHSVNGKALWTVEDLADNDGTLHPVQQALVQCHASQCGFCTPGFVMSLFALYESRKGQYLTPEGHHITREQAQAALSGNLCRCTGYRPILDAAQTMQDLPPRYLDDRAILQQLEQLRQLAQPAGTPGDSRAQAANAATHQARSDYLSPGTLAQLLHDKATHPTAQLVAGCTDVGLWVNKMHQHFAQVLDTTQVQELRRVEHYAHHIAIGAAVPLTDAFAALVADRPHLAEFANRFAGLPVRNAGTLGGNVANGSPIGDSMPLLIALGAHVVLMSEQQGKPQHREMALEALYTGYRQNVMTPYEVLAWINVPKPKPGEFMRVYKVSKRREDDISAICLALCLHIQGGVVQTASVGVGGVAATPVRAWRTQAALTDQPWSQDTVQAAARVLEQEFNPISDIRASAGYRRTVLANLLQRFWLESQGMANASLAQWNPLAEIAGGAV